MKTSIIQIGNSKGIILPSDILRRLHLSLKSAVSVSVDGEKIIIKSEPRQGWSEAARLMNESGDDILLIPDVFNDEDLSGIAWDK
jgi:antitoxin MazE